MFKDRPRPSLPLFTGHLNISGGAFTGVYGLRNTGDGDINVSGGTYRPYYYLAYSENGGKVIFYNSASYSFSSSTGCSTYANGTNGSTTYSSSRHTCSFCGN